MKIKPVVILLFLVLIGFASAAAQVSDKENAEKKAERRHELEKKSLGLLDEIIAGAWGLKLPENRSFVLASAADLMWTRDEQRARSLFWDALNSMALPAGQAGNQATVDGASVNAPAAKPSGSEKTQNLKDYFYVFDLRQNLLRRVAQHDSQLALDMLRTVRQPPPAQVGVSYRLPDDRDLEQEIAGQAAVQDAKRALQIARESLSKGLTFRLLTVLFQLNQKSPEIASEFAGDLIEKIDAAANLSSDVVASTIAIELLMLSRNRDYILTSAPQPAQPSRLTLTDDQKRALVETLTDAAAGASIDPNFIFRLAEILPDIEQFFPDRLAGIKNRIRQAEPAVGKQQREWSEYNALIEKGTSEELIRAGNKAGSDARRQFYEAAVIKAVMRGKADALREFIKKSVEDDSQRAGLNELLETEQLGFAVNQGNAEELQRLLPSISRKEKRAEALAEMALLLEKKGGHDDALKLLDEAQTLVKVDLKSESQSNALMTVMFAYALVDPNKAFGLIEPIIDRANDNISRLLLLDKLIKSGAVKNGEIIMQQPGIISLDFAIFKYGKGVAALANADFDRTKAAADRMQRNELRMMARLLVAQALLRNHEQVAQSTAR